MRAIACLILTAIVATGCEMKTSRSLGSALTDPGGGSSSGSGGSGGGGGSQAPAKIILDGPTSVIYGSCSQAFQVRSQNAAGGAFPVPAGLSLYLSSAEGAISYFSDPACTTPMTALSIGTYNTASPFFFAKATVAPRQSVTVTAAGVPAPSSVSFKVGRFTQLSSGNGHSCAIVNGGAFCWGLNGNGQLGNGTASNSLIPAPVTGLASGVTVIAAGDHHSCAVHNGALKCWGDNNVGQLGDGTTTARLTPVAVNGMGAGVTAISTGTRSGTCAIQNGGAQCWGENTFGQLGNNSEVSSSTPVQVQGLTSGVTAITMGYTHACAIVGGGAQCWGLNGDATQGYLGNPAAGLATSVPVAVSGLGSGVTSIFVGTSSTCAIQGGALKCWGSMLIGNGATTGSTTPAQVNGFTTGVTAVTIGQDHACAIKDGGVFCWGNNNNGGLGDMTTTDRLAPVQVTGLIAGIGATQVGVGEVLNFGCALIGAGVKCWGSNGQGSLGDGLGLPTRAPVDVLVP